MSLNTFYFEFCLYRRLLSYVPGDTLSSMKVVTDDHMFQCGKLVARVSKALKVGTPVHPDFNRMG